MVLRIIRVPLFATYKIFFLYELPSQHPGPRGYKKVSLTGEEHLSGRRQATIIRNVTALSATIDLGNKFARLIFAMLISAREIYPILHVAQRKKVQFICKLNFALHNF